MSVEHPCPMGHGVDRAFGSHRRVQLRQPISQLETKWPLAHWSETERMQHKGCAGGQSVSLAHTNRVRQAHCVTSVQ
jgi:hypothetical protein